MEQAYQNFNAGKYKEALNVLTANPTNIDSYEPNLILAEYMANRCAQSSFNCLRKLNDLHLRKFRKEPQPVQQLSQTEATLMFNMAALMVLQGRRQQALLILAEVYQHRQCFIEFMQSRLLFFLMEQHLILGNPIEALHLDRYYLLRPAEPRGPQPQWISVLQHEHSKMFSVAKQQFVWVRRLLTNQALLQLGVPTDCLATAEEDSQMQMELLGRASRRKNGFSKYYETNVAIMGRFMEGQRALHNRDYPTCLSILNFTNITEEIQNMPTTKIVTNSINGFATNNTALVYYAQGKVAVAYATLLKARQLLAKAMTGVQDKQLQLFSLNYGSHLQRITYNQALCLLQLQPQAKTALPLVQHLNKASPITMNYKVWYRHAQAYLSAHLDQSIPSHTKPNLLQQAYHSLSQAWLCLLKHQPPTEETLRNVCRHSPTLQEEDIAAIILRIRREVQQFRQSTITWLCYCALGLGQHRKCISHARQALKMERLEPNNRVNVFNYLYEAQLHLGTTAQAKSTLDSLSAEMAHLPRGATTKVLYKGGEKEEVEEHQYESVQLFHRITNTLPENPPQAWSYFQHFRTRCHPKMPKSLCNTVALLHQRIGLEPKFADHFLRAR